MDEVCQLISSGMLMKRACAQLDVWPQDISKWGATPEFVEQYTRAREQQAHAMADDVIDIADGIDIDAKARTEAMLEAIKDVDDEDKDRILAQLTREAVQRDKIRVDARKWLTAKVYPKVYGERTQVDVKHGLDDSLTALLAQSYSGAALPIVEASQPIQVIEPAQDATDVAQETGIE